MTPKARRIVKQMYTVTTLIMVATLLYTADIYFRIYRATHALNSDVQSFNVLILNSTHALTETILIIQNPSEVTFEIIFVEERLSSNPWGPSGAHEFILYSLVWFDTPKPIQPASNATVTLNETVRLEKIEKAPRVVAAITVSIRGPLVGEFRMKTYETLR